MQVVIFFKGGIQLTMYPNKSYDFRSLLALLRSFLGGDSLVFTLSDSSVLASSFSSTLDAIFILGLSCLVKQPCDGQATCLGCTSGTGSSPTATYNWLKRWIDVC